MKKYELLFILPGTLDDNEAKTRCGEILALVKEHDNNAQLNVLGKTRLAYPVKQIRYGYFYTVIFDVETDALKTLHTKLTMTRDLLRVFITEYNEKYAQSRKLSYNTDASGITTVGSGEKPVAVVAKTTVNNPVAQTDLSDINKKLDEILAGDVIPGV